MERWVHWLRHKAFFVSTFCRNQTNRNQQKWCCKKIWTIEIKHIIWIEDDRSINYGCFIMEHPIKMDDLGVPLFLETPISGVDLWLRGYQFFCRSSWLCPKKNGWDPPFAAEVDQQRLGHLGRAVGWGALVFLGYVTPGTVKRIWKWWGATRDPETKPASAPENGGLEDDPASFSS